MAQKHAKKSTEAPKSSETTEAAKTEKTATPKKAEKSWAAIEAKEKRRKRIRGFLIGLFSVFIALSMMLPSLSYIVAGLQSSGSSSAQTETEPAAPTSLEDLEKTYQPMVDSLLETLKEKPNDPDTLHNLGSYYMSWAHSGSSFVADEESNKTVNNLYQKAMEYFDQYLALKDLDDEDGKRQVRANRAMCQYYAGDYEGAIEAMRALTTDAPDFAVGWVDLGLMLETEGDTKGAKEAYQKAADSDPEDATGVKSYAESQIKALDEAAKAAEDATSKDGEKAKSEDGEKAASKDSDSDSGKDAAEASEAEASDAGTEASDDASAKKE